MIRIILILISVVFLSLYLGNEPRVSNQTANSKTSAATQKNHINKGKWFKIIEKVQINLKEFLF